jgi:hypothetical protein
VTIVDDGYDSYYAERLWLLLPGVYRADDTTSTGPSAAAGPLHELVQRIGAQMAVVRRSIDRLWADQSVETCDDWVVAYLGDLLGTNLVNALDPRGQRLDVAKTIHYRRRKGTVQVLEELASDITGWDAVVVEAFRRLARTRHGLDPAVGPAAFPSIAPGDVPAFLTAEGLVGPLTGTPAGGTLDLRNAHGALSVGTAFDESFHTADVRAGVGRIGHFTIPKLLVFLWRLQSFTVPAGTPVEFTACPDPTFTFDPTGRLAPLFLPPPARSPADADDADFVTDGVDRWAQPTETQVPGPLTDSLLRSLELQGAPTSSLFQVLLGTDPATVTSVVPELGQFTIDPPGAGQPAVPTVRYAYGFPSTIGAGTYSTPGVASAVDPTLPVGPTVTGGTGLDTVLGAAPLKGVVVLGDSLTYPAVAPVGSSTAAIESFVLRAEDETRPVIRPPLTDPEWVFTGGEGARLVLDGLLVSGTDVVLRGSFASVTITGCTFDPGAAVDPPAAPGATPIAQAVDGRPLAPTTLWVEGDPAQPPGQGGAIASLTIANSVLGPVRTRFDGAVQAVTVTDSILQALPTTTVPQYAASDVYDPVLLAQGLSSADPLAQQLLATMATAAPTVAADLSSLATEGLTAAEASLPASVLPGLNALVADATLVDAATVDLVAATVALGPTDAALFATLAQEVREGTPSTLSTDQVQSLNRAVVDAAFPVALGRSALALASASVSLTRVTVLGPLYAHDLQLSDSIVTGLTVVDNVQLGCVRFSAIVPGSVVPRQYESVLIEEDAPLCTSDAFGQPGYGQLLESVDDAVLPGSDGSSLATGADSGSEMGAFSADGNALKEQALLIKYAEYMPLGLTPVLVHVT